MTFNKKTIAVSMACLLTANIQQANAALIDLNIIGETTGNAGASVHDDSDSNATSMSANSEAFDNNNTSRAKARGNDTGWFYSTAGGNGDFTAESNVTQVYNVTNDSSDEQFFDFSFEVMNGGINAICGDDGYGYGSEVEAIVSFAVDDDDGYGLCSGSSFSKASYMAEIFLDDTSIWNSQAMITANANDTTIVTDGAVLDNVNISSNSMYWGKTLFNIDLGLFAANTSFKLEYKVTTMASGLFEGVGYGYNDAYAQFGDPNEFRARNSINSRPNEVSAPSALALLGFGLFGLGFARKRNK